MNMRKKIKGIKNNLKKDQKKKKIPFKTIKLGRIDKEYFKCDKQTDTKLTSEQKNFSFTVPVYSIIFCVGVSFYGISIFFSFLKTYPFIKGTDSQR